MNALYNGLITPHWNEIDKIHKGPAQELIAQAGSDNILLGRYVLVKYTAIVYSQDDIIHLITTDIAELSGNDRIWKEYYLIDHNIGYENCDGVVFKKVLLNNTITYMAIAQLSTSYTESAVLSRLGNKFVQDKTLTVQKYIEDTKSELQKQINILDVDIDEINGNIENLQHTDNEFEEQLTTITNHYNTIQQDLNSLTAKDQELVQSIEDLQTQINTNQATIVDNYATKEQAQQYSNEALNNAKDYTDSLKKSLLGGVSETYDTLKEIEDWINNSDSDIVDLSADISQLQETVNSHDTRITTNTNNLTTEIENRVAADTALEETINELNSAINQEVENRKTAISDLSSTITSGDQNLQSQIDNLQIQIDQQPSAADLKQLQDQDIEIINNLNNTKVQVSQNTLDIANLSKFAIIDVTELPDINASTTTVNTLYRLIEGDEIQIWWVEIQDDGTRIWQQIGSVQSKSIVWKEF